MDVWEYLNLCCLLYILTYMYSSCLFFSRCSLNIKPLCLACSLHFLFFPFFFNNIQTTLQRFSQKLKHITCWQHVWSWSSRKSKFVFTQLSKPGQTLRFNSCKQWNQSLFTCYVILDHREQGLAQHCQHIDITVFQGDMPRQGTQPMQTFSSHWIIVSNHTNR